MEKNILVTLSILLLGSPVWIILGIFVYFFGLLKPLLALLVYLLMVCGGLVGIGILDIYFPPKYDD